MAVTACQPFPLWGMNYGNTFETTSQNLNASNEYYAVIGYLRLEGASGSKTLSAAGGGAMVIGINGLTFATASTEVRLGVMDLTAGGLADGTFDVYGAKIAGTDTLTANAFNRFTMTSGTKSLTHGTKYALTVQMLNRAGADTLALAMVGTTGADNAGNIVLPYVDENGTPNNNGAPYILIEFDDGTTGWIDGIVLTPIFATSSTAINLDSTPDELCAVFTPPFDLRVDGIMPLSLSGVGATEDFEVVLYSDPLGTPSTVATVTVDVSADTPGFGAQESFIIARFNNRELSASTTYGVSIRPTTTSSFNVHYQDLGSGFAKWKKLSPFPTLKIASRTGNSGAFTEVDDDHVPTFGLWVNGAGSTSGGTGGGSFTFCG